MKKGLLGLLLAVAMAVPAFAAKGDMSINGKLGLGVNNSVTADFNENYYYYKFDVGMPISLSAEFFYGLMDNLSVGLGVNYVFDSKFKHSPFGHSGDLNVGTTNIYLAVKPEAKIESSIFSSIYLVGQIGLSMMRAETDASGVPDMNIRSGLYLGLGLGTMIKDCVIVEVVCSSSNGILEKDVFSSKDLDVQYTATTINVGYKFNI